MKVDTKAPIKLGRDILDMPYTKYNTSIKLAKFDTKSNVKIFSKEDYAQDLYDAYVNNRETKDIVTKDFSTNQICVVVAKTLDFDEKIIIAEEKYSATQVVVPFREYSNDPSALVDDYDAREFKVRITKNSVGTYYGSQKATLALTYNDDLSSFMRDDKWFTVKITSLVKGGYLAYYKDMIKCFLPGSHAAANIIADFSELLDKEINVMIENYDTLNNLYIVSYKKYIKNTLPTKIYDLEFGTKYRGVLTTNPYPFGIFIEIDNYYTGLVHKGDFSDYEAFAKQYKSGDEIDVYIKDIIIRKGEPRINLTIDLNKVDSDKLMLQEYKPRVEGKILNYVLNKDDFTIECIVPDNSNDIFKTDVNYLMGKFKIPDQGLVNIQRIDVLRKNIKLEFI